MPRRVSVNLTKSNVEKEARIPRFLFKSDKKIKEYQHYHCSGDFKKDFVDLCYFLDISVTVEYRSKFSTGRKSRVTSVNTAASVSSRTANHFDKFLETPIPMLLREYEADGIFPPETYMITHKDTKSYFQPHVEIEVEYEANNEHIKEVYLRGWTVEECVIGVISVTFPKLDRLTVLNLWNVGLTDETLTQLGKCLTHCSSIKSLNLDGNDKTENQRFGMFLDQDRFNLKAISLRNCKIDKTGASYIGEQLGLNSNLLTLNLCFNSLGDEGIMHICKGLRQNPALLSLNIGCNDIGDDGAKYLQYVLSSSPLTDEEVVQRRYKMSPYSTDQEFNEMVQTAVLHPHTVKRDHVHDNLIKEKVVENFRKRSRDRRLRFHSDQSNNVMNVQIRRNGFRHAMTKIDETNNPQSRAKTPLESKVQEINGQLWIPGNLGIANVNLSGNRISLVGIEFLNSALKYQESLSKDAYIEMGYGIKRLNLRRNKFSMRDIGQNEPIYKYVRESSGAHDTT